MRSISTSRLVATASAFTVAVGLLSTAAAAQTEQQQADAQKATQACDQITDPAQRQDCVNAQTSLAQTSTTTTGSEEAITVTGSRIPRANFDTMQPAIVIDSKQIESRGFETLGQALNELPTFGVPGASPVGAQGGSFGSGQSFVNFLGLGSQRTLTLVNGRRFVSSNTASIFGPTANGTQVDLDSINTKLVDRVETIAIGGAPIYGSDAIAGTVNVILKRNYEGIDLDAQYGISDRGDAPNYRFRALAGHNFADGRGNITASAEYNQSRGLVYNDRALTARARFYGDCPPGSTFTQCLYENRRIPSISEAGIPTVGGDPYGVNFPLSPGQATAFFGAPEFSPGVFDAQGNQVQFNNQGQLVPIDFGSPVGGPNDFNIDFSGGNGFNLFNTQQLLTNTKRYNANLLGSFDVTDNIRLFGEGWYSYSKGTNLREQPVYNSGLFDVGGAPDGPIIISLNNPFLTAAQRALIVSNIQNSPFSDDPNQDYFYYSRANTDLISGRASSATTIYRFVGGVDGHFAGLGGHEWNWEVVGNYGHSKTKGHEPALVQQNFANAVNAVRDASGNIVCAPGYTNSPMPTLSSTCAPLNLFGNGVMSQAARDYVTAIADPTGVNTQWVATASLSGALARLPGGDLSFALGAEHRYESTSFDPGQFYAGGPDPDPTTDTNGDGDPTDDRVQFGRSVQIAAVSGNYHTNEIFGELRAQIVSPSNNIPFIRSLELHGAARYVDHSTAGGDWTWTAEGRWAPIEDIAFRGNFTRAIRAPAITEAFNPTSLFFNFASDPCDSHNLQSGPDPATRQKNCAAAGIPTGFQSLSNQASFHQASAGNPDLKNEKSNAWSVGTVLTPRFIPRFNITLDWLDIKLKDAITSFTATQVVNSCYDSPSYPSNDFCPLITRDPASHQLTFVQTQYFNAAEYRYQGLIGALSYNAPTPFLGANSRLGINAQYQYLKKLTQKADPTSAPTHLSNSIGYPHHSAVVNLDYMNGPYELFLSANYTGKVKQDPDEPKGYRQYQDLDSFTYINGGIAISPTDRMTFRILVDNIFDTKPPFPVPAFGGSVSYFNGVLGRYYRFGAELKF